ncbi:glycine-rich protein [Nocardia sp. NPDC052566]|uniref:glycine-rich protein n=1 Tax=Nocardia sp. NPDC052566 TaxID=3364330 RepID=UPI0037CAFA3E
MILLAGYVAAAPDAAATELPPGCRQVDAKVACYYEFTGGEQTFVVPEAVAGVTVTAIGGRAAFNNDFPGDMVVTPLAVAPGDTLYVEVGGDGGTGQDRGGFNGGGAGGVGNLPGVGGGGASDVRTIGSSDPRSLATRLVVAGGAAGPSGFHLIGRGHSGADATTTAGGAGAAPAPGGQPGTDGTLALGGAGGAGYCGGGGGGGGYFGGGGGASAPNTLTCGNGGRGASYGPPGAVITRPRPVVVAMVKIEYTS